MLLTSGSLGVVKVGCGAPIGQIKNYKHFNNSSLISVVIICKGAARGMLKGLKHPP